jgi:hypothetical protein
VGDRPGAESARCSLSLRAQSLAVAITREASPHMVVARPMA